MRVSTVPVTTTLVTLEVQSPGGNDSVSLVHAQYCRENNPDKRTGLYINLDVAPVVHGLFSYNSHSSHERPVLVLNVKALITDNKFCWGNTPDKHTVKLLK